MVSSYHVPTNVLYFGYINIIAKQSLAFFVLVGTSTPMGVLPNKGPYGHGEMGSYRFLIHIFPE